MVLPKAARAQAQLVAPGFASCSTIATLTRRAGVPPSGSFACAPAEEIGPEDIDKGQVMVARREKHREKVIAAPFEGIGKRAVGLLDESEQALYTRALNFCEEHTQHVSSCPH